MKISEMNDKQLKEEYIAICETIDVLDCFGINDLLWRNALEKEIAKRGMKIIPRVEVV